MAANGKDDSRIRPDIEFKTYSATDKLKKASEENPIVVGGMGAALGVVGYMLYNIRRRSGKLSVHLIHTRLAAQGCVVGGMTAVLLHQLYTKLKE